MPGVISNPHGKPASPHSKALRTDRQSGGGTHGDDRHLPHTRADGCPAWVPSRPAAPPTLVTWRRHGPAVEAVIPLGSGTPHRDRHEVSETSNPYRWYGFQKYQRVAHGERTVTTSKP